MIIKAFAIVSTLILTTGAGTASPVQAPLAPRAAAATGLMQTARDAHDNDHGGHGRAGRHHDRGGDHDG